MNSPGQFEYVRPGSLDETLQALAANPGEAKLISGGYSLLPLFLKLRLAQPAVLVDLQECVPGLKGIVRTDDFVRIGSRTTHREIQESEELAQILPIRSRIRRHRRRWDRRSTATAPLNPTG